MNKKNIFLGIVFAIGVGIVFGVIIGAASGLFNSNSLNGDAKPGVTTTNADETPIKDGLEDETESQIKDKDKNNTSTSSDNTSSTTSGDSTSTTNTQNNTTSTAQPTIEQPTNTQNPTTQNPTTQQQAPAQSTRNGVVATGNGATLNVRSSSDPNSAIISQVGDGSGLTLYESANGMVRVVTANGVEGWVSEQYVAG